MGWYGSAHGMNARPPDTLPQPGFPSAVLPLPLQLELEAAQRILLTFRIANRPCLDIGFRTPEACRRLRACGGYWSSVAANRADGACLAAGLAEDVAHLGANAQLPFEDKQFDIVTLALGCLSGDRDADMALIHECHRVLKVSGFLILTVEYDKSLGLARLLDRNRRPTASGSRYSEAELFDLLKTGFDWLGLRTYCRFCMQMIRQMAARRQLDPVNARWLPTLYWLARAADCVLFFTRGYLVTAYGRRKGWRMRQAPKLADGRSISDAVLQKPSG